MLEMVEHNQVLVIEAKNGKELLFTSPYIIRKGYLSFKFVSIDDITAEYCFERKMLILKTEKKEIGVKLSEESIEWLDSFYNEEFAKVNEYYAKCLTGKIDLIISCGDFVDTMELIETSYNPYYRKVFEYTLNAYFNTKDLDIVDLGKLVLSKINLSKYSLTNTDGWEYYIVPLTDVKK